MNRLYRKFNECTNHGVWYLAFVDLSSQVLVVGSWYDDCVNTMYICSILVV